MINHAKVTPLLVHSRILARKVSIRSEADFNSITNSGVTCHIAASSAKSFKRPRETQAESGDRRAPFFKKNPALESKASPRPSCSVQANTRSKPTSDK